MPWLILAFLAGMLLAVQAALNARLGKELGQPVYAALTSFLIGTVGILCYAAATRTPLPTGVEPGKMPLWAWCGGLLGAFYVVFAVMLVPRIGVGNLLALIVGGQMLMSTILDHFGLFGLERHPVSLPRLGGAALIVLGVILMKKF